MKTAAAITVASGIFVAALLFASTRVSADDDDQGDGLGAPELSRISRGYQIAPVRLNLLGKNRALVGLGSYIVNAQGACADCHSCPTYAAGHNPFEGGDGQLNADNYLAGGVPFGPEVTSANITPDPTMPENHTFAQFLKLIRTGHEIEEPDEILQVMPWPIFRNMTTRDLRAIYEYLRAIPH